MGMAWGRGRGGGWGRRGGWGYAPAQPGWAPVGYSPGWETPPPVAYGPYAAQPTPEQETEFLKAQGEQLQRQLDAITQRITELELEK